MPTTPNDKGLHSEEMRPVLRLPEVERAQFKKNFINTAVCELRFPAILEYETKQPVEIQRALRKEYPEYEKQQGVNLADPSDKEIKHVLRSRKGDWLVTIRTYSIAVQTSKYTHWSEFLGRLKYVADKSVPLLDTDFFTRVGLRYINDVPLGEAGQPQGWINDDLIAPIVRGIYGPVDKYVQEVRGPMSGGNFTFRHGITTIEKGKEPTYRLDFDFYEENVQADRAIDLVTGFNMEAFRFFQWALGDKAKERLGGPLSSGNK